MLRSTLFYYCASEGGSYILAAVLWTQETGFSPKVKTGIFIPEPSIKTGL
jgi:hypothetical protein